MSWIPGWDAAASAYWWSNIYFSASIVALILLGVFEVISHRYSERKDELTATEQQRIQDQHDKDMAAVHLQASQANERAANLEKEAAAANERAAEIMRATAWRQFTRGQIVSLRSDLLKGGDLSVGWVMNDSESIVLAIAFGNILAPLNWKISPDAQLFSSVVVWGIRIPDVQGATETTTLLRNAFNVAGIPFSTEALPKEGSFMGMVSAETSSRALVFFGSKRPTLGQSPF